VIGSLTIPGLRYWLLERARAARLHEPLALLPIFVAILWLPLRGGGADAGPLAFSQALSFGSLAWLGFRKRLVMPQGSLKKVLAALAAILIAAGFSAAFSRDLDASVPALTIWGWLAATGFLFAAAAKDASNQRLFLGALVAALFVQSCWSFFVWWGGGEAAPQQSGTFYAPNQYAGYLLLLAPIPAVMSLTKPSRREAMAWGLVAILAYLGVALSGSRGGLIAGAIGLIAATILASRGGARQVLLRGSLLACGFTAAGVVLTGPWLFANSSGFSVAGPARSVQSKEGSEALSLSMRINWAQGALLIAARSPVIGTGLGTYGDVFVQVQDPRWAWSRYAHNHYLEALAEGGIPLMLGVMALPLISLRKTHVARRSLEDPLGVWKIGLWAGLAGASAHLAVDHDWSFPGYAVTYVVVALLLAQSEGHENPAAFTLSPKLSTAVGTVALLFLAVLAGARLSARLQGLPGDEESRLRNAHGSIWLAPYTTGPRQRAAALLAKGGTHDGLLEAAQLLSDANGLDELDPRPRWVLADVYVRLGFLEEARDAYRGAVEVALNAPGAYERAANFELSVAGNPRAAAEILDEGIERLTRRPNQSRLAGPIADLLVKRSIVEERLSGGSALRFALEATEVDARSVIAWLRLGELACSLGDGATAKTAASTVESLGAPAQSLQFISTC
jgi:O-antigen ligase